MWLVTETLRNLGGLTEFARARTATGRDARGLEVREESPSAIGPVAFLVQSQDGAAFRLAFEDHIFSSVAYREVAQRWLGSLPARSATSADRRLPDRLLDLRLEALQAANVEVSRALTEDSRSPDVHDDAAFVLAAFELREAAAGHTDPRRILARITAHLALARSLRESATPSSAGRLAEIAVAVLSGRMADAVEHLDARQPSDGPGIQAWERALRLYATQDWRSLSWSDRMSLVERFAWLAAFRTRVGSDRVYTFLQSLPADQQSLPDWGRIILKGWPSVRDCHSFAVGGVAYDLAEAEEASRLIRGKGIASGGLASALNEEAPASPVRADPGGPRVEVLDWGTVASFVQRHVGARLSYEAACYEKTFGLPNDTPGVLREQEEQFGALTLFPIEAQRWVKTKEEHQRYGQAAARLVRQRPELVTAHSWSILLDVPVFSGKLDVPPETDWFAPPMPFGTYFREGRLYGPKGQRKVPAVLYDTLVRLDPYDTGLRWAYAKQSMGHHPPYDQMVRAYGPSLQWDVRSMRNLAGLAKDHPIEQRRWLTQVCELEGDFCAGLAWFLVEQKEEAAAAEVYRRYWREGIDRVQVSNSMDWLVEHERKRGALISAFEIARDAAATYSYNGLRILADLAEATGNLEEAESTFRKLAERYESPDALFTFYGRRIAAGQRRYQKSQDHLLNEVFPGGFEKVDALPTGAPRDGVVLSDVEEGARAAGFAEGDIAVALDGVRLHSRQQWRILRDRSTDPDMRVLIYHAGAYRETRCRFEKRIIPATISSYPRAR